MSIDEEEIIRVNRGGSANPSGMLSNSSVQSPQQDRPAFPENVKCQLGKKVNNEADAPEKKASSEESTEE